MLSRVFSKRISLNNSIRFFRSVSRSSVPPIVSCEWLEEHLQAENISIVDASWHMPAAKRNAGKEYSEQRIPGATFFDLDAISDRNSDLAHMVPHVENFNVSMSQIGVSRDDVIVIYDTSGIFSAARCWYMLRAFGANHVAVLDGGFPMWKRKGFEIESGHMTGKYRTQQGSFEGRFTETSFADKNIVRRAIADDEIQVVDARPYGRFDGSVPDPRAKFGVRSGCMPNSFNLPFDKLLTKEKCLKNPEELKKEFVEAQVDINKPIITSCGSGVTACILSLGLHSIHLHEGAENQFLRVYDGSWQDWGSDTTCPVINKYEKENQ